MKDIKELISTINEKIYKDEPILMTASQLINYTPPKYRQMRKIAVDNLINDSINNRINNYINNHSYNHNNNNANNYVYYDMSSKTFYDQGKFMEDFEDDYEYKGDFLKYFPTYQSMNDQHLRGYFTWRTKVRKGDIEKASLSFVFVYIYELLNGIGVNSPEAGYQVLKNFWQVYQHFDNSIDFYMKLWLKDYVIYHNLDKSLLKDIADYNFDKTVLMLLNYNSYTPDEIFNALNSLSSYNLGSSKFYKLYPDDVIQVVYSVFSKLSVYYNKNRKNNICEKFFGEY